MAAQPMHPAPTAVIARHALANSRAGWAGWAVRAAGLMGALLFGSCASAQDGARFYRHIAGPGGKPMVSLADGEHEPRSVGSYVLRVYSAAAPDFPFDDFQVGLVRARAGVLRDLRWADIDGDGKPEVIVVMQSAASGGRLSAEAFSLAGRNLRLRIQVSGVAPGSDVVAALVREVKAAAAAAAAATAAKSLQVKPAKPVRPAAAASTVPSAGKPP